MKNPLVFISRKIALPGLEEVFQHCQAEVWEEGRPIMREELLDRVPGKEGLLVMLTDQIDADLMDAAGGELKVISTYSVGVDHIDLAAATQRGIAVGHTPGVMTETVADFTFALLLAAARQIVEADDFTRSGQWHRKGTKNLMGVDVHGATLGIVGFGRIGQAVARRANAFGMKVLFYDHHAEGKANPDGISAEAVEMDRLLAEADFVSLHVPLTETTRQLFNKKVFEKMKDGAMLINTARGGVVDQAALCEALESGKLAGAGLDVYETEPLPADSPLVALPNVVLAPHIGSASRQTRERMLSLAAENLLAGLEGKRLPHCANPEVYRQ